jgi:dynein heavy chain
MEGLPNDSVSVDNAIIIKKCVRWPLMIDPQGEANRWLKKHEKENNLKVINFEESNYLKVLELSIQSGYPVLI